MAEQPFESRTAMRKFLLESVADITSLLKTIDNPNRFEILVLLMNESKNFKDLLEETQLQKSALGNHLNILIEQKLVTKVVRGLYQLSSDGEEIVDLLAHAYLARTVREQERLLKIKKLIGRYTKLGDETVNIINEGDLEVKIIRLAPMKVVQFHTVSKTPEEDVWKALKEWTNPQKLLDSPEKWPVYGFNNPDPVDNQEEYGYELWVRITPEIKVDADLSTLEYSGGLYAVTTTRLFPIEDGPIPAWKKLGEWVKNSNEYDFDSRQMLEKHLNPKATPENLILELYCPIKEI
ncbi:MAG: effector binding domain-containing protein [Candidatus Hodarchaeales archaeon]|jgi:DNA-binding transcriptional ArsR family regulator